MDIPRTIHTVDGDHALHVVILGTKVGLRLVFSMGEMFYACSASSLGPPQRTNRSWQPLLISCNNKEEDHDCCGADPRSIFAISEVLHAMHWRTGSFFK